MKYTVSRFMAVGCRYVVCSATLLGLLATSTSAQSSAGHWYQTFGGTSDEHGQVSELKNMHRVFLALAVMGGEIAKPDYQPARLALVINNDIGRYPGLDMVKSPADAEFVIFVTVWPHRDKQADDPRRGPEASFDIEFSVVTRGAQRAADIYAQRLVYFSRRTNESNDLGALRREVGRLIDQLKRLRGEK